MSMVPANAGGLARPEGLEDFEVSDQVLPTIRINHSNPSGPCFEDALSNEKFTEVNCVILGLIKQRILWPPDLQEEGKASWLCRSYDFKEGHPTRDNTDSLLNFPWEASGITPTAEGTLACANCKLQQWDTHPKRNAPWCSAQYTFAVMLQNDDGGFYPSLLQVQRSALKPANSYISSFVNASKPLFTAFTTVTLETHKKGTNVYGVPKFVKGEETPKEAHGIFAENYRSVRTYLQTPFSGNEEEAELPVETPVEVQQAPAQPAAAPVAAQPAPAAAPAAPVEAPAAPAAQPTPAPLGSAGVAPAAPVAAPVAASAPVAPDDDGIPF